MNAIAFHSGISTVHGNQHCFTVYQAWIADDSIDWFVFRPLEGKSNSISPDQSQILAGMVDSVGDTGLRLVSGWSNNNQQVGGEFWVYVSLLL